MFLRPTKNQEQVCEKYILFAPKKTAASFVFSHIKCDYKCFHYREHAFFTVRYSG